MRDVDDNSFIEPNYASDLTASEVKLRDKFVTEYLSDYDEVKAAVRVGYPRNIAKEYSVRLMGDPYVLQQIKKREATTEEETTEQMRKRVLTGLIREANYTGPGGSASARVAALSKLAAIAGMDAPSRSQTEIIGAGAAGAGMFVVPGLMTVEQWEAAAEKQQNELIASGSATLPNVRPELH